MEIVLLQWQDIIVRSVFWPDIAVSNICQCKPLMWDRIHVNCVNLYAQLMQAASLRSIVVGLLLGHMLVISRFIAHAEQPLIRFRPVQESEILTCKCILPGWVLE